MRNKIIGIAIIVLVIAVMWIYPRFAKEKNIVETTQSQCTTFIQYNIGTLSPTSPVLGGKRYTTNISYATGTTTAVVNYEDGHIAETISIECSVENQELKIGAITRLSTQ